MKHDRVLPHSQSDVWVPSQDVITLTRELVENCRTVRGGFTGATIRAFGLSKADMKVGWPSRLVGKRLSNQQYRKAVEGKFEYASAGRMQKVKASLPASKVADLVLNFDADAILLPVPRP